MSTTVWQPTDAFLKTTNVYRAIKELGFANYAEFHQYSYQQFADFWRFTINQLNIQFTKPVSEIIETPTDFKNPHWLPGAAFNISNSCFTAAKEKIAIICQDETSCTEQITYGELNQLSNRIANSLQAIGINTGDCIAIYMPMNIIAVAIYLGIIKLGAVVVSIPSSFATDEISTRIRITNAKLIFTQDVIMRDQKTLPLYEKCQTENMPQAIVFHKQNQLLLRAQDLDFNDFLLANDEFLSIDCNADSYANILFSSGTTGDPKAIVWQHATPIKCASDAYYHHNVQSNDILAWPTDLGWMMGPWLLYATFINQATLALFEGSPTTKQFGQFIQDYRITILGLIPSIVSHWKTNKTMEHFDWSAIKLFSSSGECSNVDDMAYLMQLAGCKPIIEYCGGTEIAGAYITSILTYPNIPATFNTPALGLNFIMLNDENQIVNNGEVAIMPPSIGLSNVLFNRDNEKIYYDGMPTYQDRTLRRHGDQIEKIDEIYYRALGRVDDTMNLGGIKVSSAEIERVLHELAMIKETAAIAINPKQGGPSLLVIYAVPSEDNLSFETIKTLMQSVIKNKLNPLYKIHDLVFVKQLPRTASNKIMRRLLRDQYSSSLQA